MTVTGQQTISTEDRQNAIDGYIKDAKQWHDQCTRYRCTFAEDYCRGAIAIVYELKLSASGRAESNGLGEERLGRGRESLALLVFHHQTSEIVHLDLRGEEHVLVRHVELVKLVEGFTPPSLVRLYFVDEFVRDTEDGNLFQSAINKSFQLDPSWVQRELSPVFVFAGTVGPGDSIPCVVKGAVKVMDSIAKDQSEAIWQGLNRDDLDKLIAGFRISLDGDSVRTFVASEELGGLKVEIADVLVGPFNL